MKEGMIQPRVQRTAPRGPANRVPTKVEELMETGPGVISAMVIRSVNSAMVISLWTFTIWSWISGIAA